jgi:molybdenum cofactor guanylyltransferase
MNALALFGLVLTGGRSRRMQRDKASLEYAGKSQLARAMELLTPLVGRCFVSVRADQLYDPHRAAYDTIADIRPNLGPIGGIHAALHTFPEHAWLVLACDLPFLDRTTLEDLIARRADTRVATAYCSSFDALPEPLCAIFEPRSLQLIEESLARGQQCPRALLSGADVELLDLPNPHALACCRCAILRCCANRPAAAPKRSKRRLRRRASCTRSCAVAVD